jgi:hypothetical protein
MDKNQFINGVFDIYDTRLLESRLTEEGNVCGALLSDITLYDDCGLSEKDFITKSGRMLFTIGKQIRDKKYHTFDEITFLSNANEDVKDKINNEFGGFRQIQNVMDAVSLKNYDSFLDDLNKSNIMLSLYRKNFNLLEEMTLDNGKKVIPYQLFKKLTASEVIDFYEGTLATLDTKINSSKIIEQSFIDFDDAFLERLENKEEVGVSFGDAGVDINGEVIKTFPFTSSNILGLKHGTLNCWAAHSGAGKSTYMITVLMSLIAQGERVTMITNESSVSDVKIQFLVWVLTRCLNYWEVTKKKIASGNLTEKDKQKIKEARQYWKDNYAKSVKITSLSDADARLTCQIIKKDITRGGYTGFLVDTFKLSMDGGNNDAFWMSLIKDTRALTEIAMRHNVIGLMTVQLALNSLNRCWIDASCLSNSRGIKETLSNLIMFRKVTDAELDPASPYFIHPFRHKQKEDGTWYEEEYLPDRSKVWRLFFIDKCRRGADSNDTGVAYLVRYDGDFCCFYETAKARPTHKLINTEGR